MKLYRINYVSLALTAIGFLGLWFAKLYRDRIGLTEQQFMQNQNHSIIVWILSGLFIAGLLVLFPVSLILERKNRGTLESPTNPSVPSWLMIPLGIVLFILVAACLFGFICVLFF